MTDTQTPGSVVETPDSIHEFVIAGDFGFNRFEGPWAVETEGTKWTIILPDAQLDHPVKEFNEGEAAVLIADGEVVGGGIVEVVFAPDGEGETHIVVDQYAKGRDSY